MLFTHPVPLVNPTQPPPDSLAMPSMDFATCRARIGRGGRLILSRCQPFSLDPLEADPAAAEDVLRPPPFDLAAPYVAAEAQYQQELQSLPKQQPGQVQGQGQRSGQNQRHASPSTQSGKGLPPVSRAGTHRANAARQSPVPPDGSPSPQPSTSQPGLQQTRHQQQLQQQQQQPQLIEMPSQPGASLNGPSPPKSKVPFLLAPLCTVCIEHKCNVLPVVITLARIHLSVACGWP